MQDKELKKLITTMRNNGVLKYKTPEIELELSPAAIFPKDTNAQDTKETNEPPKFSEEEVLFWSSAPIPEDRAKQ